MARPNRPSLGHYDFALRDPPTNEPLRRSRANSRLPEFEPIRTNQVNVDSSSEDDIPISKPKRPGQHSRSMSHPFPSLFSSKKRKNARPGDQSGNEDFSEDMSPSKPKAHPSSYQNAVPRRIPRGPADFATGNCMTCASLVRWPKELHVFRCTICLTINDLKPYDPAAGYSQSKASGPLQPNETEFSPSRSIPQACMFRFILGDDICLPT